MRFLKAFLFHWSYADSGLNLLICSVLHCYRAMLAQSAVMRFVRIRIQFT